MDAFRSRRLFLQVGACTAAGLALPPLGDDEPSTGDQTERDAPLSPTRLKLAELLVRVHAKDAELRTSSTNHLPMALCALAAIGGTDAQLARFFESEFPTLEPFPKDELPADDHPWYARLGERAAFPRFVAHFRAELASKPRADVLREALVHLEPALAAFAFHGLIRTAYAVRVGDAEELAHGLGFWASRAAPFAAIDTKDGVEPDPTKLAAVLRQDVVLGADTSGGSVMIRMAAATKRPGFAAAVSALRVEDATLDRLSSLAARAYLANGNLTTLHGVTGTQAYRVLEPYVADRNRARRTLWQALASVYLGTGAPELAPLDAPAPPSWDTVLGAARERLDDHDVKLADAAREEERVLGGALHRRAAAKRLGLG
ncbi:MAG: questin oxidase family protein [Planctomycetes bacterium]|nr:questin oxidase family protein [Planctomycetota bacterium]